jgi:hypothetical protein
MQQPRRRLDNLPVEFRRPLLRDEFGADLLELFGPLELRGQLRLVFA